MRLIAVQVAAVLAVSVSGCATSGHPAAPEGCTPAWPKASETIVRPGRTITISATASICTPRFTHDHHLTITGQDRAGRRTRLADLQAYPSGAFEQTVRIPKTTQAGPLQLFVDGLEIPCADNASCAAYETGIQIVTGSPDFTDAAHLNQVASGIAERMTAVLHDQASLVGLAIVPDGIQAVLATTHYDREQAAVTRAFERARSAALARDRAIADTARIHVTFSQHPKGELARVSSRITHDTTWQRQQHLTLTRWGPDLGTDSVRIHLPHYTDTAARTLTKRYGTTITVATTSLTASAS